MKLLVTGGAGFIGSNFIRYLLAPPSRPAELLRGKGLARRDDTEIVNFDKLTYAGNPENLAEVAGHPRYRFVRGDIADGKAVSEVFAGGFDAVVNFAAETHVDRSIEDASPFLRTNVVGTHVLLEAARQYRLPLFVHISTDEVYGSAAAGESFREDAPLNPSSPYAASKAAADHLVAAFAHTYRLPVIILRCTNNHGPCQFPEKLIPLMIANASEDKPLPVYGDGLHERDWLYVEDFCRAIELTLERSRGGGTAEVYNVSSGLPQTNLKVVKTILQLLGKPAQDKVTYGAQEILAGKPAQDNLVTRGTEFLAGKPAQDNLVTRGTEFLAGKPDSLIRFVEDRPGHDRRYALDSTKIRQALAWKPELTFGEGIRKTIEWYQRNALWLERARSGEYRQYYERHYTRRSETLKSLLKGVG